MEMPGFPVSVRFPMQWGEMDALQHANNVRYFAWFEAVRIELFRRVGMWDTGTPTVGPILATANCTFLAPIIWPAQLLIGTRVSAIGTTSFTIEYGVAREEAPERLHAKGDSVIVLIEYATGRKVPLPDGIRAALGAVSA
jgi:acyl-CoA thioester hydrolase